MKAVCSKACGYLTMSLSAPGRWSLSCQIPKASKLHMRGKGGEARVVDKLPGKLRPKYLYFESAWITCAMS